jgi:hypothetical protein
MSASHSSGAHLCQVQRKNAPPPAFPSLPPPFYHSPARPFPPGLPEAKPSVGSEGIPTLTFEPPLEKELRRSVEVDLQQ